LINQSFSILDKRKDNGGNRAGAGRKPKAEEQKLIERLSPLADVGYKALENALKDEQGWAVKLFFEYLYGKPKQSIDQTTTLNVNDFDIKTLYDNKAEE
tara:strand:- start:398 stop:694 length:297 start_codon:yes stop_codon:yes gene_type:complete